MIYDQRTAANTATQLHSAATTERPGATSITALSTNTEGVFIGFDSSVTINNGEPIYPGQSRLYPTGPQQIYVISASGGQKVGYSA